MTFHIAWQARDGNTYKACVYAQTYHQACAFLFARTIDVGHEHPYLLLRVRP